MTRGHGATCEHPPPGSLDAVREGSGVAPSHADMLRIPIAQHLRHAVRASGRRPLELVREYLALARGRGKLAFAEYVQWAVWDPDLEWAEKTRFLSERRHWPITWHCCDPQHAATTENKWLCARILEGFGIAVVPTCAVVDALDARAWPDTRTVRDARALRALALEHAREEEEGLFFKPVEGLGGEDAFMLDHADTERAHVYGQGWMTWEELLERRLAKRPFLVQGVLRAHPFLRARAAHLATVRVCVLPGAGDARAQIPFAVLKLPGARSVTDTHWAVGCALSPETGAILRACSYDTFGSTPHAAHPDNGAPLVGERLPHWEGLRALAEDAARVFGTQRYQSMDIALTGEGPRIVEVNTGGSFALVQLAYARGFLTDAVREHFVRCGVRGL